MKKMKYMAGLAMLGMVSAGMADAVLIDDTFASSSMIGDARLSLGNAGVGGVWSRATDSDWTIAGGVMSSPASATSRVSEGVIGELYTVSTTDTSLTKINMSFEYTVGVGSTLYYFANGLTTNGSPDADEQLYNTMATGANPQDLAETDFADISLLTGGDPASGTGAAVSFDGGVTGTSGTYNVTIDLSSLTWSADEGPGVTGDLANITDLDYIAFMFGNNVTVTDGTGAVTIDNFKVTAIPEPATLGLVAFMGGGLIFMRRFFQI